MPREEGWSRSSSGVRIIAGGIAVHDLGGSGPPVILCHANGLHGLVFRPLAERLASHFHCWSLDFRGHGDSTRLPEEDFDWRGFGDDVLAVVRGLALERPSAVGHSLGGTALLLAELARPGTLAWMYCFEPIVLPEEPAPLVLEDNPYAARASRRREVFGSRAEAEALFATKPPFSHVHPEALRAYLEHGLADRPDGSVQLKCRPADEARVFFMASAHPANTNLPQVRGPVVLAGGRKSRVVTPATLEELASRLPYAQLELFDDLGHFGPLENPVAVGESILTAFRIADGVRAPQPES